MCNSFDTFADLPVALQKEALREGELLLQAQLSVAAAADQRALTWSGFLLTGATASIGGGIALINRTPADLTFGYLAVIFAAALLVATWLAISTVAPTLFCLPGNRPGLWLPDQWDCVGSAEQKAQTARVDQARHLDKFIKSNKGAAEKRGKTMRRSMALAFWSVAVAALLFLGITTARHCAICVSIFQPICRSPATAVVASPAPHKRQ